MSFDLVRRGIDWFIPDAELIGASDLGLARTFVVNQLVGPVVLQAIAGALYLHDGHLGIGLAAIVACISSCWLTPLLLKITGSFHVAALVSVELLCGMALIGISQYGGMQSPFMPWLLVSLMLGFFYMSDRALLVLGLFAVNLTVTVAVHGIGNVTRPFDVARLSTITWFSIFAATAYMSRMALYYASIVSMGSHLERSIEAHRRTAQELTTRLARIEVENRGRAMFFDKVSRQARLPLAIVAERAASLDARAADVSADPAFAELGKAADELRHLMSDVLEGSGRSPQED